MALLALDSMHFTQTRIATIDSYVVFFIMVMYLFMIRYVQMSFFREPLWKTLVPLGLSGLFMGFAWASKWTGIYASAGLAFLFFLTVYWRAREYFGAEDREMCIRDRAGRLAPTAKNLQEQKIYVVQSAQGLAKIDAVTPCRYGAPTVLIVAFDKNNVFVYPGGKRDSGVEDAAIVATHMMLAAKAAGVESCWLNFFDPEAVEMCIRDSGRSASLASSLAALLPLLLYKSPKTEAASRGAASDCALRFAPCARHFSPSGLRCSQAHSRLSLPYWAYFALLRACLLYTSMVADLVEHNAVCHMHASIFLVSNSIPQNGRKKSLAANLYGVCTSIGALGSFLHAEIYVGRLATGREFWCNPRNNPRSSGRRNRKTRGFAA